MSRDLPNPRITPELKQAIARSSEPAAELARRYAISAETVRKWRERADAAAPDARPEPTRWGLSRELRTLICDVRRLTRLEVDDLVEALVAFLPSLTAHTVRRSLAEGGCGRPDQLPPLFPGERTALAGTGADASSLRVGAYRIPILLARDGGRRGPYVLFALHARSRALDARFSAAADDADAAAFLNDVLDAAPHPVATVLAPAPLAAGPAFLAAARAHGARVRRLGAMSTLPGAPLSDRVLDAADGAELDALLEDFAAYCNACPQRWLGGRSPVDVIAAAAGPGWGPAGGFADAGDGAPAAAPALDGTAAEDGPWIVAGVSPELRARAAMAAVEQGQTLPQWLEAVIAASTSAYAGDGTAGPPDTGAADDPARRAAAPRARRRAWPLAAALGAAAAAAGAAIWADLPWLRGASPPPRPVEAVVAVETPAAPAPARPETGRAPAAPPGPPPEQAQRLDSLQKAALAGAGAAQLELGNVFAEGRMVPQDYARAAHWYREAAVQGVARAQFNLGVLHDRGLGVPQDPVQALFWYLTAAERGHPEAQYNIAVAYAEGRGIARDDAQAIRWFEKAAAQNLRQAHFALGRIYEDGRGVPPDRAKAMASYRAAADLGHGEAPAKLRALEAAQPQPARDAQGAAPPPGPDPARERIAAIQRLLERLAYQPGPADGVAGPRTLAAIRQFQLHAGLPPDGVPSAALLDTLESVADAAAGPRR